MSTLYIPAGSITNAELSSSAAVAASKVVHELAKASAQAVGSDVSAKTEVIHTARAAGSIGALKVAVVTAPTGGDKAFTVDLKKSTGGGAFSTVLSGVVTIDATESNYTAYSGVVSSAAYAAGDIFEIAWAVSGSTGSQGQGALAEVFFEEATA